MPTLTHFFFFQTFNTSSLSVSILDTANKPDSPDPRPPQHDQGDDADIDDDDDDGGSLRRTVSESENEEDKCSSYSPRETRYTSAFLPSHEPTENDKEIEETLRNIAHREGELKILMAELVSFLFNFIKDTYRSLLIKTL